MTTTTIAPAPPHLGRWLLAHGAEPQLIVALMPHTERLRPGATEDDCVLVIERAFARVQHDMKFWRTLPQAAVDAVVSVMAALGWTRTRRRLYFAALTA